MSCSAFCYSTSPFALLQYCCYFFALATVCACNPPATLGSEFLPEPGYEFNRTKEVSLKMSTVRREELNGDNVTQSLTGQLGLGSAGGLVTTSYLGFGIDDFSVLDDDIDYRYDSLTLTLPYSGYWRGDTLTELLLTIFPITEAFELPEDEDNFYTSSSLETGTVPLARLDLLAEPIDGEDLEIRLDDALGRTLFDLLRAEDDRVLQVADFRDFFPGIALLYDPRTGVRARNSPGPIVGFLPDQIDLTLHYSNLDRLPTLPERRTFSQSASRRFNRIVLEDAPPELAELDPDENLPTTELDTSALLIGGTPHCVRLELSDWENEREVFADAVLTAAHVELRVRDVTFRQERDLPPVLDVFWSDETNDLLTQQASGTLRRDREFGRDTHYRIDVLDYLKNQNNNTLSPRDGLQICFPLTGQDASFLRVDATPARAPRLEATYVRINQN